VDAGIAFIRIPFEDTQGCHVELVTPRLLHAVLLLWQIESFADNGKSNGKSNGSGHQ
jgi:hypothetical protein